MTDARLKLLYLPEPASSRDLNILRICWIAVLVMLITAQLTPLRLENILHFFVKDTSASNWLYRLQRSRGTLFLSAYLIVLIPIVCDLYEHFKSKRDWLLETKSLQLSALIFVGIILLSFPYQAEDGYFYDPSGVCCLGKIYGNMSLWPFNENSELFYRRLLSPATSYLLFLRGKDLYYFFSMACAFMLIFLSVLSTQNLKNRFRSGSAALRILSWESLCIFSFLTSSFILLQFQWPGYPEQLGYLMILLLLNYPFSDAAKISLITCILLTHDGLSAVLIPFLFFLDPTRRRQNLAPIALLILFTFFAYGFDFHTLLERHESFRAFGYLRERWPLTLLGIFSSYKLFLPLCAFTLYRLKKYADLQLARALFCIWFFPYGILLLAHDATRLTSFGFVGPLILFCFLLYSPLKKGALLYTIRGLALLNIFIPTYNIDVSIPSVSLRYAYPGLYQHIDALLHQSELYRPVLDYSYPPKTWWN